MPTAISAAFKMPAGMVGCVEMRFGFAAFDPSPEIPGSTATTSMSPLRWSKRSAGGRMKKSRQPWRGDLPMTICVTLRSMAAASSPSTREVASTVAASAPSCRASERLLVRRFWSSGDSASSVVTAMANHGASSAPAMARVRRISDAENGLGPTATNSRSQVRQVDRLRRWDWNSRRSPPTRSAV